VTHYNQSQHHFSKLCHKYLFPLARNQLLERELWLKMALASAYSPAQIQQYEEYIALPHRFRQAANPALDAEYLTALHIHKISSVPYENLIPYYSTTHTVSLDPQVSFKKIVTDARERGGYCMEKKYFL